MEAVETSQLSIWRDFFSREYFLFLFVFLVTPVVLTGLEMEDHTMVVTEEEEVECWLMVGVLREGWPTMVRDTVVEVAIRGKEGREQLSSHSIENMQAYKQYICKYMDHYIILNNEILKSNSSIFPRSEGYITQYTP